MLVKRGMPMQQSFLRREIAEIRAQNRQLTRLLTPTERANLGTDALFKHFDNVEGITCNPLSPYNPHLTIPYPLYRTPGRRKRRGMVAASRPSLRESRSSRGTRRGEAQGPDHRREDAARAGDGVQALQRAHEARGDKADAASRAAVAARRVRRPYR